MNKEQIKCQYVYTNTSQKGEKCGRNIRQKTTTNVFEDGCYCSRHVQQRKKYNPEKINVGRPKGSVKPKKPLPKNLELEIFNFETKDWDIETNLSKNDIISILSEYPKYHVVKIISSGPMSIYPHIKVLKKLQNEQETDG